MLGHSDITPMVDLGTYICQSTVTEIPAIWYFCYCLVVVVVVFVGCETVFDIFPFFNFILKMLKNKI